MKRSIALISALSFLLLPTLVKSQSTTPRLDGVQLANIGRYQGYVKTLQTQIDQEKIEMERQKAIELDAKAKGNQAYANQAAAEAKRFQQSLTVKQAALTMYQQQISLESKPHSANPAAAQIEQQIDQLTLEKGILNLSKLSSPQPSPQLDAQISQKEAQLAARRQDLKLAELRAKTGR